MFSFYHFPLFLCIAHLRSCHISPCYSLELCIQLGSIFPFPPCLSLLFFSQIFVRPPQTTTLPSCISFSLGWFWSLPPVHCSKLLFIVLRAVYLSDLILWIYSSPQLYNHKGFDLDHLKGLLVFFTFFNLSLNFAIKSSWSEPQWAPGLIFADFCGCAWWWKYSLML